MLCQDARTMKRPFSDRLKQAATYAQVEYSQTAIAKSLGTSKQTVDDWMKGGEPSRKNALLISERWGVNLHWLVTDEGDMLPTPIEDDLSPEERMILRSYRRAGPDVKRAFISIARGIGKAALLAFLLVLHPPADLYAKTVDKNAAGRALYIMSNWLSLFFDMRIWRALIVRLRTI